MSQPAWNSLPFPQDSLLLGEGYGDAVKVNKNNYTLTFSGHATASLYASMTASANAQAQAAAAAGAAQQQGEKK